MMMEMRRCGDANVNADEDGAGIYKEVEGVYIKMEMKMIIRGAVV